MTIQQSNFNHSDIDELLSLALKHGLQLNPENVEINESGMDFQRYSEIDEVIAYIHQHNYEHYHFPN